MKSSSKKTIMLGVGIIIVAAVIAVVVILLPKRSLAPTQQAVNPQPGNQIAAVATSTTPIKMAPIPHGSQTYQIMQAAGVTPKIVQATVNPVDVHVGDTQTLTVIVSDPNPVTSVVANIQTDNGTTTVPLMLVGPAASDDILPQRYSVNTQNQLMLAGPNNSTGSNNVAQAAEGDEKYSVTWTVKDTHVARYFTTFTATDNQGNVNSAKIAWTDAQCGWSVNNYNGAQWNVSSGSNFTGSAYGSGGCSFGSSDPIDGPENALIVVDEGVTIGNGYTFVLTPGSTMTFSGSGQVTIAAGGEIATGQMYGTDADHDGYLAGSSWSTSSSAGPARSSDTTPTIGFNDCNDSNANVFPGQTAWFTTATTTNVGGAGSVNFNYNCSASINSEYSGSGQLTSPGNCSGPSTCNSPVGTLGIEGIPSCGSALPEVVDEGDIAACLNNGVPTGQHCDVWANTTSTTIQACN